LELLEGIDDPSELKASGASDESAPAGKEDADAHDGGADNDDGSLGIGGLKGAST
jgi:hypothetical protein